MNLSRQISAACLADHYAENPRFRHLQELIGRVGVLFRVNCVTCNACWLEVRNSKEDPPRQAIFLNPEGEERVIDLPYDPINMLGAVG